MKKHWYFIIFISLTSLLSAQAPVITPKTVPSPGEIYTFKWIKKVTDIDTSLTGENLLWDFDKVKDTASYYEEVYRESTPSQNEIFEDSYSVDSNTIKHDLAIWINYLDSSKYYRLGAFEKPSAYESEIPYIYHDTIILMHFPFTYGSISTDKYEFTKNGRKHHKNQYIESTTKYDAYGVLILPNGDTCQQAMRIRREEKYFHIVDKTSKLFATKLWFYWYDAGKPNHFIRVLYINGTPTEAWYQKKRAFLKKKKLATGQDD